MARLCFYSCAFLCRRHWCKAAQLKSRNYAWSIALACVVHACAADPPLSLHGWVNVAPEEVGIDSAPLAEMIDFARERRIPVHSVQIIRSGKLAFDAYFYPYDGTTRHDVASVTKSVTSILVGLAIERGQISSVQQSARELALGRAAQGE